MTPRWIERLIRLYPLSWRQRYGQEFKAFLEGRSPSIGVILNIAASAFFERVRLLRLNGVVQDVRFAFRSLRRRPSFTVLAVLTLALGIGSATASFSLVDGILLRPLPYRDPQRIVSIWLTSPGQKAQSSSWDHRWFSYPEYEDLRDRQSSFDGVALTSAVNSVPLLTGPEPQDIHVAAASWTLFPVLGAQPLIGRLFTADDDRPGAQRTIVLGHALWQQSFGGDAHVLGKTVDFDEFDGVHSYIVIGVMPGDFHFKPETIGATGGNVVISLDGVPDLDAWVPVGVFYRNLQERSDHSFSMTGRLKRNVSLAAAQAEVERLVPGTGESIAGGIPHLHGARLITRYDQETASSRGPVWVLFAVSGLLLIIACGNVSNLLLGEIAVREEEIAVRAALGAGWIRIVQQLITESLLISILGGMLGLPLAMWGTRTLVLLAPRQLPRMDEVQFDLRVFGFALLIAIAAGTIFGLAPAFTLRRGRLGQAIRESGGRLARRTRLQQWIVVGEITLSFVLLVSAGLLVRSFRLLASVDPGFQSENLLVMRAAPSFSKFGIAQLGAFYRDALERLRSLPGVTAVSGVSIQPFGLGVQDNYIEVEGRDIAPAERPLASRRVIFPDYFKVVGIPLVSGRAFNDADNVESSDAAIVNNALAFRFWPKESPIDKRIRVQNKGYRIVGVVSDVKDQGLRRESRMTYYLPQAAAITNMTFIIRTSGPPLALSREVKQTFWSIDKGMTFPLFDTSDNLIAASLAEDRYRTLLIGIFAAAAGLLAAIGLYGVVARSVVQRMRELGIRMALGADSTSVVATVLAETMRMTAAGVVFGIVISLAATRVLSGVLFGVTASDLLTYAGAAAAMVVVALLASFNPAWRAIRIDPIAALRAE